MWFSLVYRPGDDFRTWIERVANIVVCGLFATAMSWFILPWYASDNQLLQMGEALQNSAQFVSEVYAALQTSGKEAFKVNLPNVSVWHDSPLQNFIHAHHL